MKKQFLYAFTMLHIIFGTQNTMLNSVVAASIHEEEFKKLHTTFEELGAITIDSDDSLDTMASPNKSDHHPKKESIKVHEIKMISFQAVKEELEAFGQELDKFEYEYRTKIAHLHDAIAELQRRIEEQKKLYDIDDEAI